jgi:predicted RNA methylase
MDLTPGVAAGLLQQLRAVQSGVMKRKMAAGGGLLAIAAAAYVGTNPITSLIDPHHTFFARTRDSENNVVLIRVTPLVAARCVFQVRA